MEKDDTSIDQQKNEGIKFCKKNKFDYQIYEDEGKSGFKIDDEENPFKNRIGLTRLIDDIENKIIDKVWVYENSRLSRNNQISYVLHKIFQKNNIIVFEKDKQFDMNNPQNQMIQGILTNISQYERHLIIERTKRGLHDSINRGIRGYNEMYGYKKSGKKDDGYTNWIPVKSEIENMRYSYQEILKGSSIGNIVGNLFKNVNVKKKGLMWRKWVDKLRIFVYTGYSLTTEGSGLYNKFKNFEIDNLQELKKKKYYVKSKQFPIEIVSVENWIKVIEKLQIRKRIYKEKMRNTDTEYLTGVIQCPFCELKYFLARDKGFIYYRHYPKGSCKQKPKSMKLDKMNNLFGVFFFYFYLVFDDTRVLIEENQKIIKLNQLELKDKIKNIETENNKYEKQINRFQSIYEETNDKQLLKLTLEKEKELNMKREKNTFILNNLKTELEELVKKYNDDEVELTYYDIKERIINFFETMSVEEKRTSIIKILKYCQLFNKYLVIDTGKLLFTFNIEKEYIITENIYNKFKRDKRFRDNFLNSSKITDKDGNLGDEIFEYLVNSKEEMIKKHTKKGVDNFIDNYINYVLVRNLGNINIKEYPLKHKEYKEIKTDMKKQLDKLGIKYSLVNIDKIISFTEI